MLAAQDWLVHSFSALVPRALAPLVAFRLEHLTELAQLAVASALLSAAETAAPVVYCA
jgi:hypothetical protein